VTSRKADNADSPSKSARPNPRAKGYPRKRKPIPDDQIQRDKRLSRKLYSVVYAFPFLVLIATLLFVWLKD